jgi:hypothetical protein
MKHYLFLNRTVYKVFMQRPIKLKIYKFTSNNDFTKYGKFNLKLAFCKGNILVRIVSKHIFILFFNILLVFKDFIYNLLKNTNIFN